MGPSGIALVATLVCLAGCTSFAVYDQRGGPGIADEIRNARSPVVEDVGYNLGDYMDAATIDVTVREGTSGAQEDDLLCAIILPAIERGDPPDSLGVSVWDHASTQILASDEDGCPEAS